MRGTNSNKIVFISITIIFSIVFRGTLEAQSADKYYVSFDLGLDTNSGSFQQPWRTITHAIQKTQPGDTIILKQSVNPFDEWVEIRDGQGGAPEAYKTIRNAVNERPIINGIIQIRAPYVKLEGLKIIWKNPGQRSAIDVVADHLSINNNDVSGPGYWAGIYIAGNDVLIEGNEVHDFGHGPNHSQSNLDHGIYVAQGNRIVLRNNRIHHNTAYGIHVYDHGSDSIDSLIIEGNQVYQNGNKSWHKGIIVSGEGGNVRNVLIHHNIIWGHKEAGMLVHGSGITADIYNNTIYEESKTGIVVSNVNRLEIKNNLIYQTNLAFHIENIVPSTVDLDYNGIFPNSRIYWLGSKISHTEFVALGFGSHDVLQDPRFVNVAGQDFHLNSDSPAIDAGIDVGLAFIGSAPDLGALEDQDTTTHIRHFYYSPLKYHLYQNYPNPFQSGTKISYQVPTLSFITLRIFNSLGQQVATLVNEEKPRGFYEIIWNGKSSMGREVSNGIYFYSLEIFKNNVRYFSEIKKMLLH